MANFLGNMNWEKMSDLFGHAAAMYTPGGVAEWQRDKDARANNELLRRIQEQQLSQAKTIEDERASRMDSLSRIMGPVPTSPSPASFGYDFMTDTTEGFDAALAGDVAAHQRQTDMANIDPEAFIAHQYKMQDPSWGIIGTPQTGMSRVDPNTGKVTQVTEPFVSETARRRLELAEEASVRQVQSFGTQVPYGEVMARTDGTYFQRTKASDGTFGTIEIEGTPMSTVNRRQPKQTNDVDTTTGEPLRQTFTGTLINSKGEHVPARNAVSASAFNKDRTNARQLYAAIKRGEDLIKKAKANPELFGGFEQLMGRAGEATIGQLFPGVVSSALFTPEQLNLKAQINAEAAATIKDFYGAVLTKTEEGRANTFTVQEGESLESLMAKIEANIINSKTKFPGLIQGAVTMARDSVYGTDQGGMARDSVYGTDQGGMDLPEYQTPEEAETAFMTGVITYEMFHLILKQLEEDENNGG
jgi:hypothetical protein